MKKLFPVQHVMGYVFSLILSVVALSVVFWDMPMAVGLTILLICAAIQMSLQLFLFMHISEGGTKPRCSPTSVTPCSSAWSPFSAPCSR
ncbi:hypothetical protein HMSSN036_76290 [Paenibacillus macerans]|nr:hypothetical protein HMSSN036_76290 [Paenibacillus macerans]